LLAHKGQALWMQQVLWFAGQLAHNARTKVDRARVRHNPQGLVASHKD